jgi:hypothetical protein
MILLRFNLSDRHRRYSFCIQLLKCRHISAALIHRQFDKDMGVRHHLIEEALGSCRSVLSSQQEVDRLAFLVDRPMQIFQGALTLMYVSSIRQLFSTARL